MILYFKSLKSIVKISRNATLGVLALKSVSYVFKQETIGAFFVFKLNKCRGPPLIKLFKKNKLIGE